MSLKEDDSSDDGDDGGAIAPILPWRARAGEDVRTSLDRAARLLTALESGLDGAASQVTQANRRIHALEQRIRALEEASHEAGARLAAAETGANRLLGLYAATYQLHATLDPDEVLGTLAEIALNLLGAHSFGVLLTGDEGEVEVALAEGMPAEFAVLVQHARYHGGDPLVDACLADGGLRLGGASGSPSLAAVPLTLQGHVVGVLAIWRLLDHREALGEDDHELLGLLSSHAAMALCAARLHSGKDRKLKALEGVVGLLRGGGR